MRTRTLTSGAAVIMLTLVSFFFFRGMTNLVNSITVPLTFLFFTRHFDPRSSLFVGIALLLAVLMLFPSQILFTLIYLCMAMLLKLSLKKGRITRLLYPICVTILLILGVVVTDKVFLTEINAFMLRISGGSIPIYLLIFFVESLVISGLHFFFYHTILHRSKPSRRANPL